MPSPTSLDSFVDAYAAVGAANQRSFQKLSALLRRLNERHIDFLLLKGADLLTRVYPTLGTRLIGDVDLLVREADLPRIDAVARELGLRPKIDGNAAYIDADGDFPVDLATDVWYLEDVGEIWDRAVRREVLGCAARAMEATDLLTYLCAWVCLHRAFFSTAFAEDVALVVRREPVDWARFQHEALRRGLKIPFYHALRYVQDKRPGSIPDAALLALAPSSLSDRALLFLLRRLVTTKRLPGLSHLLVLLTRPRGRRWPSLRRAFAPDARFMAWRYGARGRRETLGLRLLRPFQLAGGAAALAVKILLRLVGIS